MSAAQRAAIVAQQAQQAAEHMAALQVRVRLCRWPCAQQPTCYIHAPVHVGVREHQLLGTTTGHQADAEASQHRRPPRRRIWPMRQRSISWRRRQTDSRSRSAHALEPMDVFRQFALTAGG